MAASGGSCGKDDLIRYLAQMSHFLRLTLVYMVIRWRKHALTKPTIQNNERPASHSDSAAEISLGRSRNLGKLTRRARIFFAAVDDHIIENPPTDPIIPTVNFKHPLTPPCFCGSF